MNQTKKAIAHLDELLRALCIIKVVGQVEGHDVVRRASVVDVTSRRLDWARGLEVAAVAAAAPAAPAGAPGEQFADWFMRHYPADTVISNPQWHAERILRAAQLLGAPAAPAPAVCGGDGLGQTSCGTPHHVRVASGQTWCRWECTSCGGMGRDTWD